MPRLTPEDKLAKLHQEQARIMAELRSTAGRVAAKTRKNDTRRKILLGTILLEGSATNPKLLEWVEGRIRKLPEKDAAPFLGWNFADAAAAAATRAKEREKAAKAAVKAPAVPSSPAPAQAGAFGGALVPPQPNTAPAPRGAPSAQPSRVPPARS